MADKQHIGVLISNLGTPDEPTPKALRRYLAEFLSDPRVIEKPRWLWYIILHGIILNIRPRKAAKAYQSVWTDSGSPLMKYTCLQGQVLQEYFHKHSDHDITVGIAMRYGTPSIASGLERLKQQNCDRIIVLPLYPQYSATTTASTYDAVFHAIRGWRDVPPIQLLGDYHLDKNYIAALAQSIQSHWDKNGHSELLVMSFHGLPQSYVDKGDPYQRQCQETACMVADKLGLQKDQWRCTFQSRFGPEQWLQPYTDKTLEALAKEGVKSIDILCPGFSADCLETIEEIGEENREIFMSAGGESFHFIPCLNESEAHIRMMAEIIEAECG